MVLHVYLRVYTCTLAPSSVARHRGACAWPATTEPDEHWVCNQIVYIAPPTFQSRRLKPRSWEVTAEVAERNMILKNEVKSGLIGMAFSTARGRMQHAQNSSVVFCTYVTKTPINASTRGSKINSRCKRARRDGIQHCPRGGFSQHIQNWSFGTLQSRN